MLKPKDFRWCNLQIDPYKKLVNLLERWDRMIRNQPSSCLDEDQKHQNVQLLRDTFRIILNPEWAKSPQALKCHTQTTLKKVREDLHKQGHSIPLCDATDKIIDKPWNYEELRRVLTGHEPVSEAEAIHFCSGEGSVVLLLRLQWLSCEKSVVSLALKLICTCIQAIRAEDVSFRSSCSDLELSLFEDIYVLLLSEFDLERLCTELTSQPLEYSIGVTNRILTRFQSSSESSSCDTKSSHEDILKSFSKFWQLSWSRVVALIEHLLLRVLAEQELHPDLSEVVAMFTWSQLTSGMTGTQVTERFTELTNIYEKSVEQVYAICDGMFRAGGNTVRSFTLKHYILAMTVDLNRHHTAESAGDIEVMRRQEVLLGSLFMQVAKMVRDQSLIFQDCVRAAFLLNPSEHLLELLYLMEGRRRIVTCGCDRVSEVQESEHIVDESVPDPPNQHAASAEPTSNPPATGSESETLSQPSLGETVVATNADGTRSGQPDAWNQSLLGEMRDLSNSRFDKCKELLADGVESGTSCRDSDIKPSEDVTGDISVRGNGQNSEDGQSDSNLISEFSDSKSGVGLCETLDNSSRGADALVGAEAKTYMVVRENRRVMTDSLGESEPISGFNHSLISEDIGIEKAELNSEAFKSETLHNTPSISSVEVPYFSESGTSTIPVPQEQLENTDPMLDAPLPDQGAVATTCGTTDVLSGSEAECLQTCERSAVTPELPGNMCPVCREVRVIRECRQPSLHDLRICECYIQIEPVLAINSVQDDMSSDTHCEQPLSIDLRETSHTIEDPTLDASNSPGAEIPDSAKALNLEELATGPVLTDIDRSSACQVVPGSLKNERLPKTNPEEALEALFAESSMDPAPNDQVLSVPKADETILRPPSSIASDNLAQVQFKPETSKVASVVQTALESLTSVTSDFAEPRDSSIMKPSEPGSGNVNYSIVPGKPKDTTILEHSVESRMAAMFCDESQDGSLANGSPLVSSDNGSVSSKGIDCAITQEIATSESLSHEMTCQLKFPPLMVEPVPEGDLLCEVSSERVGTSTPLMDELLDGSVLDEAAIARVGTLPPLIDGRPTGLPPYPPTSCSLQYVEETETVQTVVVKDELAPDGEVPAHLTELVHVTSPPPNNESSLVLLQSDLPQDGPSSNVESEELRKAMLRLPDEERLREVSRNIGGFTDEASFYAEQLGVSESTLSSLYNVLEYGRRYDFSREQGNLAKFEEYYQNPNKYAVVKELKYFQMPADGSEEEDNGDPYAGIEKGYEKYLHEESNSNDAVETPGERTQNRPHEGVRPRLNKKANRAYESGFYTEFDTNELFDSDSDSDAPRKKRKSQKRKKLSSDSGSRDAFQAVLKKKKKKIRGAVVESRDPGLGIKKRRIRPSLIKVAKVDASKYRAHLVLSRLIAEESASNSSCSPVDALRLSNGIRNEFVVSTSNSAVPALSEPSGPAVSGENTDGEPSGNLKDRSSDRKRKVLVSKSGIKRLTDIIRSKHHSGSPVIMSSRPRKRGRPRILDKVRVTLAKMPRKVQASPVVDTLGSWGSFSGSVFSETKENGGIKVSETEGEEIQDSHWMKGACIESNMRKDEGSCVVDEVRIRHKRIPPPVCKFGRDACLDYKLCVCAEPKLVLQRTPVKDEQLYRMKKKKSDENRNLLSPKRSKKSASNAPNRSVSRDVERRLDSIKKNVKQSLLPVPIAIEFSDLLEPITVATTDAGSNVKPTRRPMLVATDSEFSDLHEPVTLSVRDEDSKLTLDEWYDKEAAMGMSDCFRKFVKSPTELKSLARHRKPKSTHPKHVAKVVRPTLPSFDDEFSDFRPADSPATSIPVDSKPLTVPKTKQKLHPSSVKKRPVSPGSDRKRSLVSDPGRKKSKSFSSERCDSKSSNLSASLSKEPTKKIEDELADFAMVKEPKPAVVETKKEPLPASGEPKFIQFQKLRQFLKSGKCPPETFRKLQAFLRENVDPRSSILDDLLNPRHILPRPQEHIVQMVQIPREATAVNSSPLATSSSVTPSSSAQIQASVPQPSRNAQTRPINLQQIRAVVTATSTQKPGESDGAATSTTTLTDSRPAVNRVSPAVRSQTVLRTAPQAVKSKITTSQSNESTSAPSTSHCGNPVFTTVSVTSQPKNERKPAADNSPTLVASRLQAYTSSTATNATAPRVTPVEAHRSEPKVVQGLAVPKTGARQALKNQQRIKQAASSTQVQEKASTNTHVHVPNRPSTSVIQAGTAAPITAVKSSPVKKQPTPRLDTSVIAPVRQVVLPQGARAFAELKAYPSPKELKNPTLHAIKEEPKDAVTEPPETSPQPALPKFNQVFGKKSGFETERGTSSLAQPASESQALPSVSSLLRASVQSTSEVQTLPSVRTLLRASRFPGVPTVQKVVINNPLFRNSQSLDSGVLESQAATNGSKSPTAQCGQPTVLRRSESASLPISETRLQRSDSALSSTHDHFSEQLKEFENVYKMVANGSSNLPLSQPEPEPSHVPPVQQFGNIDYTDYSSAESFTSSVSLSTSSQLPSGVESSLPCPQTPDDQRSDSSLAEIKVESASPSPVPQIRERNPIQSRYVIVPSISGLPSLFTIQGAQKSVTATKSTPEAQRIPSGPTTPKGEKGKPKSPVKLTTITSSPVKVPPGIGVSPPKAPPKPADDHDTVLRVQQILEEYSAQVQKSPDLVNKPAPRRRSNPPPSPNHTTKRRKSPTKVKLLSENCKQEPGISSRPGTAQGMDSQPKTVIDLTEASPTPPPLEELPPTPSPVPYQVVKPLIVTSGQAGSVRMFLDPSALSNIAGRAQRLVLSPMRGLRMLTLRGQQGVVGVPLQGQTFQIRLCQPAAIKTGPDPVQGASFEPEEGQQLPDGVLPDVDAFLAEGKPADPLKKEIFVGFEDMINYQIADSHFQPAGSPQSDVKPTLVLGPNGEMRALEPQSQVLHAYNNHGKYEPLTLFRGEEETVENRPKRAGEPLSSQTKRPRMSPDEESS